MDTSNDQKKKMNYITLHYLYLASQIRDHNNTNEIRNKTQ